MAIPGSLVIGMLGGSGSHRRRRWIITATALGCWTLTFSLFWLAGLGKISVPQGSLVIRNGTVIDGTGAQPLPNAVVVLKDGRIWAVGTEGNFRIPGGVTVLDAGHGYILPGLIDAHVHVWGTRGMRAWTEAGVTTVRDLGGPSGMVLALKYSRGEDEPRLYVSGPILTVPGGYPIPAWGEKVAQPVKSPREAGAVVDGLIDEGVDVIKIAVTEGLGPEFWPTLSMDEIKAITAAAHRRGVKVAAHILRAADARRAVEGGVDQLAHDPIDELPQELILQMVNKHVVMIPTLEVLVQGVEEWSELSRREKDDIEESLMLNVRRFEAMGGQVAMGDDYGVTGVFMGLPLAELLLLQRAGLTPLQVIQAATLNSAGAIGHEQDLGSLEPGKEADILVVGADPLQDLTNLRKVKGVIFQGQVLRWEKK